MGRQRTINDSAFWRSPKMAGRTHEDRATLSYLLTSPFSNIIGVYEFVPRIAASEMGWDSDSQLMPVLRRLSECRFVELDEDLSYLWVRIWWDHNSPTMAVGGTLRQRTLDQIAAIPMQWRDAFIDDFVARLPKDNKKAGNLQADVEGALRPLRVSDRVSLPYPYPTDSRPGNNNDNSISNATTTPLRYPEMLTPDQRLAAEKAVLRFDRVRAQQLLDELSLRMASGGVRHGPLAYLAGLIRAVEEGAFTATASPPSTFQFTATTSATPSSRARAAEELARLKLLAKQVQ
ncbi:hypothetical protein [Paraburkholderia youngii]|uniref:Uncharacterized protein n=1 Tax=Paraburkholderia youngii TaxID=2782701 RepID=A0A7W8L4G6_9BURK|nr:hypothetical protein [Paraburkholderia youngii]MBB5400297.1 hypothetical protein [Paraburkholderia youngii]